MVEAELGRDVAGKMHTARSRNDIAITLYRMTARREVLKVMEAVAHLRTVLLDLAEANVESVMPAHTHTQPAQPTTLAHYLLAACEFLGRDTQRLQASFARINVSPMGAAALTTSGFPIDRAETARLLGFEGLAENSYGAIASIDYVTEAASVVAVAMVNLGKLTQTSDFGLLKNLGSCVFPMLMYSPPASCLKSATPSRWNTRVSLRAVPLARPRPC